MEWEINLQIGKCSVTFSSMFLNKDTIKDKKGESMQEELVKKKYSPGCNNHCSQDLCIKLSKIIISCIGYYMINRLAMIE